jgi:hypothetical protein
MGDALGHLARVDEDERRAVLEDVGGDEVEHVGKLRAAGDCFEFAVRKLDGYVEVAPVAAVHDGSGGPRRIRSRQEASHHLEGALGGRQSDALESATMGRHQLVEPLEGEGEMRPPLVAGERVHLVDDDGVHSPQDRPR